MISYIIAQINSHLIFLIYNKSFQYLIMDFWVITVLSFNFGKSLCTQQFPLLPGFHDFVFVDWPVSLFSMEVSISPHRLSYKINLTGCSWATELQVSTLWTAIDDVQHGRLIRTETRVVLAVIWNDVVKDRKIKSDCSSWICPFCSFWNDKKVPATIFSDLWGHRLRVWESCR